MRVPFVLLDATLDGTAEGDRVPLAEGRPRHLQQVLRRSDGDPLVATDGGGRVADAVLDGDAARLVQAPVLVPRPQPALVVHLAMPKRKELEDIVRSLVELGVSAVHPVVTARSVVRPDDRRARSVGERLRSVAASACEQARSAHLCAVSDPAALVLTERDEADATLRLLAHPDASATLAGAVRAASAERPYTAVELAVGPEGGFTDGEVADAERAGWVPVQAGHTVLRTVHAGTVLASAVLALTGRFG